MFGERGTSILEASAPADRAPTISSRPRIVHKTLGIDLRSLAAMRIGLALLLLVDLADRITDLTAHYTDAGVMPRSLVAERATDSPWSISLHMMSGAGPVEAALFAIAAFCAVALLIGWRTRLFNIASWFLLMSLHNRNPMILQGGDVLLRMMLFFGMFLPLGARWSFDAVSRRHRGGHSSGTYGELFFSAATVALLLQIAFMYWFSVGLKRDPVWWRDFTAVYTALRLDHFVSATGKLFLPHPRLLKLLTAAALAAEALGPLAAFVAGLLKWPFRTFVVFGMIAFHTTMAICLKLGLFSFICSVAWMAFLPAGFWDFCHGLAGRYRIDERLHLRSWKRSIERLCQRYPRGGGSPWLAFNLHPTRISSAIAVFFIVYIFLWNVRTLDLTRFARVLPAQLNFIAWLAGTGQVWDMFSPAPLREGGWFVMPAQLADGEQVDLFRSGAPLSWEKPALVSAMYKNDRWRKYLVNLAAAAYSDRRLPYAQWLARTWNEQHPANRQILTFQIFLMEQDTLPDYRTAQPKPILLWLHDCRPPAKGSG
jgi:hypothetical protein